MILFQNALHRKGDIYKGIHEGWYSVSDEAFYSTVQTELSHNEKGEEIRVRKVLYLIHLDRNGNEKVSRLVQRRELSI